jgi:hypothetical protein
MVIDSFVENPPNLWLQHGLKTDRVTNSRQWSSLMNNCVYTIGHSNHPIEAFIQLLHRHGVTACNRLRIPVRAVREKPFSVIKQIGERLGLAV